MRENEVAGGLSESDVDLIRAALRWLPTGWSVEPHTSYDQARSALLLSDGNDDLAIVIDREDGVVRVYTLDCDDLRKKGQFDSLIASFSMLRDLMEANSPSASVFGTEIN